MLTDIFSDRYSGKALWFGYDGSDARFFVQASRLLGEQIFPEKNDKGQIIIVNESAWKQIHDRLTMELGVYSLRERGVSNTLSMYQICQHYLTSYPGMDDGYDDFIKNRISLIELAFRLKAENIKKEADRVSTLGAATTKGHAAGPWPKDFTELGDLLGIKNAELQQQREISLRQTQQAFQDSTAELNERMRRAGYSLNYHNGFIQISDDQRLQAELETPFWMAAAGPEWKSVDLDMKEAIDQRDSGGKDPALYAAKALESAIKIISDKSGVTTGNEKGAQNYIEGLASARGGNFLSVWEREALSLFFSKVRNPLGHGSGSQPAPTLTAQQTDWAIGFCMSSIRSLIQRL